MSDSGKAVFLSYASQDAEAAKRICDALRAAGVEVWFDADGGLEHGDEWDAKIRRQIKECVLFLPIVSASTQAREEGYFRIEWDLAAERARGIASGVAFILPVVIDDTKEPAALVPDRFRTVQWTRLPGGNVPPDVLQRFLKLWSHRTGALKHEAGSGGPTTEDRGRRTEDRADPGQSRKRNTAMMAFAILGLVAVAAIVVWRPWQTSKTDLPATRSSLPATVPQGEARQLVARARGLMDKLNVLPTDLNTAAGLLEQAAKLDPNEALVWSTWAQLDLRYVSLDYDNSPSRHNAARSHVAQANALDPASRETRYTQAEVMRNLSRDPATVAAAEQILRPMLTEAPEDGRVLIQLGWVVNGRGRRDEALALFDRAALLPASAAEATYSKALVLILSNQFEASDHAYDQLLALEPTRAIALCSKAWLSVVWHANLEAARDFITRIPPQMMVEDMAAFYAYSIYMFRREYDLAVQAIRAVPRDYLSAQPGPGPSGFYIGNALAAAGKSAAAEIEWRRALATVERRLAEAPSNRTLMEFKALLLARLGDRTAGERVWKATIELYGDMAWGPLAAPLHIEFLPPDEAIAWLNGRLKDPQYWFTAATLRFHPLYDSLRANPKFTALVEKMEADPRFAPKAAASRKTEDRAQNAAASGLPSPVSSLPPSSPPQVDDKSVAVLAFANLSDDKANEYFSDGISEELLTVLQKIPGLKVSARTSSFSFKGREATAQEIGAKLGVANLVEGSVRRAGNQVRISARLSRAATGEQVWSESYTRDLQDIFAVQSELAETIVAQLRGQLDGSARTEIKAQVRAAEVGGTRNVEAHQLYLQGQYFMYQLGMENLTRAAGNFQRAVELDPQFALAWAMLARAGGLISGFGRTSQEAAEGAALSRRAAERALAAAPNLALAHLMQSQVQSTLDFDWNGAAKSARRAQELASNDPNVLYVSSTTAYFLGRPEEAIELGRQAVALDPVNVLASMTLVRALESLHRFPEAESEARRITELSPTGAWAHTAHGRVLLHEGKFDAAVAEAKQGPVEWARAHVLAMAYWGQGKNAESDAALQQLIQGSGNVAAFQVAQVFAYRRDNDQAFAWLERALAQRDSGLAWMKADLTLRLLHDDPRWPAFLHKMGLADDQLK